MPRPFALFVIEWGRHKLTEIEVTVRVDLLWLCQRDDQGGRYGKSEHVRVKLSRRAELHSVAIKASRGDSGCQVLFTSTLNAG
jgi:hypothetical protein